MSKVKKMNFLTKVEGLEEGEGYFNLIGSVTGHVVVLFVCTSKCHQTVRVLVTGLPKDGMENKIRTNQYTSKGQNSGLAIQDGDEDPNLILCKYIQLYLEYIV